MKLFARLVEAVTDDTISLTSCLLQAKEIAHRLQAQKLKEWVDAELKGYQCDPPAYRTIRGEVFGDYPNPLGPAPSNWRLVPLNHLSEPVRKKLITYHFRENVSALALLAAKEGTYFAVPVRPHWLNTLGRTRGSRPVEWPLVAAEVRYSLPLISGILATIRAHLQDLLHELREADPTLMNRESEESKVTGADADRIADGVLTKNSNTIDTGGGSIDNRSGTLVQARDIFNVTWAAEALHARQTAFEPRPEEADILTRVLDSRDQTLIFWEHDDGIALLIGGQAVVDPKEKEVSQTYLEGFKRLREYGLVVNNSGNALAYDLSTAGRALAKRLRGKCPWCNEPMDNAGKDPKQPPIWECNNPDCLHSTWHRNKRCEACGKRPVEITDSGCSYAAYRCEDGHSWTKEADKD